MNRRRVSLLYLLLALSFAAAGLLAGCGRSSPTGPTTGSGGSGSHNAGRDCLTCHRPGGAPTWTVAGTVYRSDGITPYPGATVRLTTGPDGTGGVVLTLTIDGSGNFHTSNSVDFGAGLFADVVGTDGVRLAMPATVPNGACNSCHDASNRIRAS